MIFSLLAVPAGDPLQGHRSSTPLITRAIVKVSEILRSGRWS
jgi:hypothetical protein